MAKPRQHSSCILLVGFITRHHDAIEKLRKELEDLYGAILCESELFPFDASWYYNKTMGSDLYKGFIAFKQHFDPGRIGEVKHQTNALEDKIAASKKYPDSRPVNLDPGYISLGKLVLASAKDYGHRIYLGDGMYAEITLKYEGGGWIGYKWTFPDYLQKEYHAFFSQVRDILHQRRKNGE